MISRNTPNRRRGEHGQAQRILSIRFSVSNIVLNKIFLIAPFAALCIGCGMSDQDIRQRTGDAAVAVKHAAETAGDKLKGAYSDAAEKGKEAMKNAGDKLGDEALKAKVNAGFGLVAGLDAKNINVDVRQGKVY